MSKILLGPRDRAVYKWEDSHFLPIDCKMRGMREVAGIVGHVWHARGLGHPPIVCENPRLNPNSAYSNRHRLVISGRGVTTWVVLHELAHSFNLTLEESIGMVARPEAIPKTGSSHDENWLGLYVDLLNDFMGPKFNKLYLMKILRDASLGFEMCPKLRCLEG